MSPTRYTPSEYVILRGASAGKHGRIMRNGNQGDNRFWSNHPDDDGTGFLRIEEFHWNGGFEEIRTFYGIITLRVFEATKADTTPATSPETP